ncbi:hypothetical protein D3C76_950420 [compost metagenome]
MQGENDQAQADTDAAQLSGPGLFAREKKDHPEEDQQRRQPRQVESQHPRHQRRTDIGAEHDRQRRGQGHQPLTDKGGHQHCRRVTALDHGGHQDPGKESQRTPGHVLTQHAPQVGAIHPQDAGTHNVRAPDQQRHGGKQIEQGQH